MEDWIVWVTMMWESTVLVNGEEEEGRRDEAEEIGLTVVRRWFPDQTAITEEPEFFGLA